MRRDFLTGLVHRTHFRMIIVPEPKSKTSSDLFSLIQYVNDPETSRQAVRRDMGRAVKAGPPYYGRQYNGWWETRNLRMASNIRAALAEKPGARALVIVGELLRYGRQN